MTITISVLVKTTYSYFFFNNFDPDTGKKKGFNEIYRRYLLKDMFFKKPKGLEMTKYEEDLLLYGWLIHPTQLNNIPAVKKVFQTPVNFN